uniref:Uncharacterized protein n=1 Tax=Magallana gigas TaxID=29159 RepID=K1QDW6_MAGGI
MTSSDSMTLDLRRDSKEGSEKSNDDPLMNKPPGITQKFLLVCHLHRMVGWQEFTM